ncbi:hypothetical protein BJY04DRAFT_217756 [Aspergillus karnatakaensis]|uniref:fungal specific transcription factor domain-containing protein n=1 Tax=Aspergillus karnatakaensis TaxID=1810916 RepID=UPI003CCCD3AE
MPYPHVYPSPPRLGTMTTLPATRQGKENEDLERAWFFYLAEIALRRIMNDALSSRYRPDSWYQAGNNNSTSYTHYVSEYKQKLLEWYHVLPTSVSFTLDTTHSLPITDILSGILHSHYIDILDVVYFPAIRAVACSPMHELTPDILRIAREALRNAVDRITISRPGYWHRHQGTWLMLRTCSRSALCLLGVALRAKYEERSRGVFVELLPEEEVWRTAVVRVIGLIEYWVEESGDLGDLVVRLKGLYDLVQ